MKVASYTVVLTYETTDGGESSTQTIEAVGVSAKCTIADLGAVVGARLQRTLDTHCDAQGQAALLERIAKLQAKLDAVVSMSQATVVKPFTVTANPSHEKVVDRLLDKKSPAKKGKKAKRNG